MALRSEGNATAEWSWGWTQDVTPNPLGLGKVIGLGVEKVMSLGFDVAMALGCGS